MTHFKFSFLLLSLTILMVSCSQESLLIPEIDISQKNKSTKISLSEALMNAELAFDMIGPKTRSVRIPETVEYVGINSMTRSNESDDVKYYIVNYANNQGFAVLSADEEKGKVFAISDEGSISLTDTASNPGLNMFFSDLNKWIDIPVIPDTTINVDPIIPDTTGTDPLPYVSKVLPKIPKNARKWYLPRNMSTNQNNKALLPMRSGITACAQIFAAFQHPQYWKLDGKQPTFLNWDAINSFDYPEGVEVYNLPANDPGIRTLYNLMEETDPGYEFWSLGDGPDSRLFKSQGYEVIDLYCADCRQYIGISIDQSKKILDEGYIHIFRGDCELTHSCYWAIDGYIQYKQNSYNPAAKYNTDTLYHCVWGLGGKGDGYYAFINNNDYKLSPSCSLDDSNDHNSYNFQIYSAWSHAFRYIP